jgi:hypothetical protein
MDKIKIFVLFAIFTVFFACGSQDGGPPELKNGMAFLISPISPFDTLVAEFDSDITSMGSSTIPSNIDTVPGKKLYFVGKNTTLGGLRYFDSNIKDSIVFTMVKNSDGYVKDRAVLYFSTLPILEDLNGENIGYASAIDLKQHFVANKIQFAGVLDHEIAIGQYNVEDYYKISMSMYDTLKISAEPNAALEIKVKIEPGKNGIDTTFNVSAKKKNNSELLIDGRHLSPSDPSGLPADFYIIVSDNVLRAPPNSYKLSISHHPYHWRLHD